MRTIKTRDRVKSIKVLNQSVNLSKHMKNSLVQVKERAEETQYSRHASPSEYATNNVQETARNVSRRAANHLPNPLKKARETIKHTKEHFQEVRRQLPKERLRVAEQAQNTAIQANTNAEELRNAAGQAKETAVEAKKALKDAKNTLREVRQSGRKSINDVKQSVRIKRPGLRNKAGSINKVRDIGAETPNHYSRVSAVFPRTKSSVLPKSGGKSPVRPPNQQTKVNRVHSKPISSTVISQDTFPITKEQPPNIVSKSKSYPNAIKPMNAPSNSIGIEKTSHSGYLRKGANPLKNADSTSKMPRVSAKSTSKSIKTTKKGLKDTAKGTVKTAKKSAKTAERSAKTAVKTARQTAKTTRKSAQAAVKAAKTSAKVSRVATKNAVQTAKAAVKTITALVKMAIAAIKGLVTIIIAGGWIAVLIIIITSLVGLFAGSIYGVFFSNEPETLSGETMSGVIAEINNEFTARIDDIINTNIHDLLDITGDKAPWNQVLAVYTVRTVKDPNNPMDTATMDEQKASILRTVFWDMNIISYTLDTVDYKNASDAADSLAEVAKDTGKTKLSISVTNKTPDEMASRYGFTDEQKEQLKELLSPEYDGMWNALIYGVSSVGDSSICEVAASQIGNIGGEPYWRWYGFNSRVEWCAVFVSWCADQCGYIDAEIIPKFSSCANGVKWFKDRGQWQDSGYIPCPGDIIFYDYYYNDGVSDHVGIVERVEGDTVYTIEGNTGVGNVEDICAERKHNLGSSAILGYGVPAYTQ